MSKRIFVVLILATFLLSSVYLVSAEYPMNASVTYNCSLSGQSCSGQACCSGLVCCSGVCQSSCGTPGPGPGPGPGPAPPPMIKEVKIVEYPQEINVTSGETKTFSVTVKNNGTVDLNVSVSVSGLPFSNRISPEIALIQKGTNKSYIITLLISNQTASSEYNMLLKAFGDSVSDNKTIVLRITAETLNVETRLLSEINDLEIIINKVWNEIVDLGINGTDVKNAFATLNQSKTFLGNARNSISNKNYTEAENYIEAARAKLEETVNLVAQIKTVPVTVVYPAIPNEILILLFILLVSVVIFVAYIVRFRRITRRLEDYISKRWEDRWGKRETEEEPAKKEEESQEEIEEEGPRD